MPNPVVLVHGFASSFQHGWGDDGWADLLADEGREVIGEDLPGHGSAPKPTDPSAYDAIEETVLASFGDHPQVDAVGFSLGARILLTLASDHPERFGRLVVMGVGANLFREDDRHETVAQAVESGAAADDIGLRVFSQMAADPRNDRAALAALIRRRSPPLDALRLSRISGPVLVVIGSEDFAGPADALVDALPDARLVVVPGLDHFATPKDFRAIDAALRFLGG